MTGSDQLLGWVIGHRLVLVYLVRAIRTALPDEAASPTARATEQWLQQSLTAIVKHLPPAQAALVEEAAAQEIHNILFPSDLPLE